MELKEYLKNLKFMGVVLTFQNLLYATIFLVKTKWWAHQLIKITKRSLLYRNTESQMLTSFTFTIFLVFVSCVLVTALIRTYDGRCHSNDVHLKIMKPKKSNCRTGILSSNFFAEFFIYSLEIFNTTNCHCPFWFYIIKVI